jgi:sarcosine oxidase, subunit beta
MSSDVLVVGGGVIGASVAFHLAARGATVTVLDRGGDGSFLAATGGGRAQFGTAVDVQLSLLSRAKLARFRDETGVDPGLQPNGYLFVAETEAELAALREAREVQRGQGWHGAAELDAREVLAHSPAIAPARVLGGMLSAEDGFLDPRALQRGYLAAAVRRGVRLERGVCHHLVVDGDRVVGAETSLGRLTADTYVNAAGAWAGTLGVPVPVTPLRRQVALTQPTTDLAPTTPMTIFLGDGFHFRVRGDRVLLLLPSPAAADPWDTRVDPAWLDRVAALARTRVPGLRAELDRAGSWAGLYEMSPDGHALLGRVHENLLLANGSSGHGVMHSPALGQLVAELACRDRPSIDIRALAPDRDFSAAGKTLL